MPAAALMARGRRWRVWTVRNGGAQSPHSAGAPTRCPLCKVELRRLVITLWRARGGEDFEALMRRERATLWQNSTWAPGVFVDKTAPAPAGFDRAPLPAVLRARARPSLPDRPVAAGPPELVCLPCAQAARAGTTDAQQQAHAHYPWVTNAPAAPRPTTRLPPHCCTVC